MADATTIARGLYGIAGGFRAIGRSLLLLAADTKKASDAIVSDISAAKAAVAAASATFASRGSWNPAGAPLAGGASQTSGDAVIGKIASDLEAGLDSGQIG